MSPTTTKRATTESTAPFEGRTETVAADVRPLRADASRNREAVLRAARRRFRKDGEGARIEDIAADAGVGVGTVCRRFPGKEAMLAALVEQRFEGFAERARTALNDTDPWAGFDEYLRHSIRVVAEDKGLSEMMDGRGDLIGPTVERLKLLDTLDVLVKRAQDSGQLRKDFSAQDIPGLVCGIGRAARGGEFCSKTLSWQRYLEIVLDGLRAPA